MLIFAGKNEFLPPNSLILDTTDFFYWLLTSNLCYVNSAFSFSDYELGQFIPQGNLSSRGVTATMTATNMIGETAALPS